MVNRDSICQWAAQLPSRHRRHGAHLACRWLRQYWRPDGLDGNLLRLSAGDSHANTNSDTNGYTDGYTDGDANGNTDGDANTAQADADAKAAAHAVPSAESMRVVQE